MFPPLEFAPGEGWGGGQVTRRALGAFYSQPLLLDGDAERQPWQAIKPAGPHGELAAGKAGPGVQIGLRLGSRSSGQIATDLPYVHVRLAVSSGLNLHVDCARPTPRALPPAARLAMSR